MPDSSIPWEGYSHGPLQLLILDGAVQCLQKEKQAVSRRAVLQVRRLLLGTENAHQAGPEVMEFKTTSGQLILVQPCLGWASQLTLSQG